MIKKQTILAKIGKELVQNSRISTTQLAKKVKISRELAQYYLKNHLGNEIKPVAIINPYALGFSNYVVFCQIEQEQFLTLQKHNNVYWIGDQIGEFNAVFDVLIKNKAELLDILSQIKTKRFIVLEVEKRYNYPARVLGSAFETLVAPAKEVQLDKIEKQMLGVLNENPRITFTQMAKQLHIGLTQVRNRFKRVMQVIPQFSAQFSLTSHHEMAIQLKVAPKDKVKVIETLRHNSHVTFIYSYYPQGHHDLDVGFIYDKFHMSFLTQALREFDVTIVGTSQILQEMSTLKLPPIISGDSNIFLNN